MDSIAGIGNFSTPNPGHLNMMTLAMIKDKDGDGNNAMNAEEMGVPTISLQRSISTVMGTQTA